MSGDFDDEEEMYPLLRNWLLNKADCDTAYAVNEKPFKFTPADKGYIPDLIGRTYDELDNPQYIGIEAKKRVRDDQRIINQSVSSLAFCHKAYLALPKRLFLNSSQQVQDRIEGRVRRAYIGLLLVLRSRVDEHIPAPPQRTIQRIYNEVGEFFKKHDEEDFFWDEESVWSETQVDQFLDLFYSYAPDDFKRPESPDISIDDSGDVIFLDQLYHEEIETAFTINPTTVSMDIRLQTDVLHVLKALMDRLDANKFQRGFRVYYKRPGRWNRRGMVASPCLKIILDEPDLSVSFSSIPNEGVAFNLGTLLKNHYLATETDVEQSAGSYSAEVFFSASLVRETFQGYLSKEEETSMELLHELLREGTKFLTFFIENEE